VCKGMLTGVIGLLGYSVIHSFILAMEMFTLHVVLTSSPESVFSFIFYNNFSEIKITVFKKTDLKGYFQYACNDGVERVQLVIYLLNILLTTKKSKTQLLKLCLVIMFSEALTD
jgi:Eukaryotic membrane protein family